MFKKLNNLIEEFKNFTQKLQESFALLGPLYQLGVVVVISIFIIFTASLILEASFEDTYTVFIDPPALPTLSKTTTHIIAAPLLMFTGLVALSFIISVVSASLEKTFREIRKGRLNYHGNEHTIIVNYNNKLEKILSELNLHNHAHKTVHDVVILLNDDTDIENLQEHLAKFDYHHLKIYVRYGDILDIKRYKQLSVLTVRSIIILSDYKIKNLLKMHNDIMKIINLLYSDDDFRAYLQKEKQRFVPVKAIAEFYNTASPKERSIFSDHVKTNTNNFFRAIYPKEIVSHVLNMSMLDLSYYKVWSELLSFGGHSFYFIDPKNKFVGSSFKDTLLQHKLGLLIGISRMVDGKPQLIFNKYDEIILENDWFIYISKSRADIEIQHHAIECDKIEKIDSIQELHKQNILIIGKNQDILEKALFNKDISHVETKYPDEEELFSDEFHDKWISKKSINEVDIIIINLHVELSYRLALNIKLTYKNEPEYLNRFIFAVQKDSMQRHIQALGIENVIVPKHLVSKYMAQVSNQVSLIDIFNILFVENGPEIEFIEIENLKNLKNDIFTLKVSLIKSGMLYLGCENHDGEIVFEAKNLDNAKKIIVFKNLS
jgi:hypothetical protein